MPVERFFCTGDLKPNTSVVLTDSEHHHLRVLRLAPNETVELVNGQGTLAKATLTEILKETSSLKILSIETAPLPTPLFTLAIPLMRPSKLEWTLEKATEIGADSFLLFPAEHSEKTALSPHQLQRLHALLISALKQSGRLYLPTLEILPHLENVFARDSLFFFGHPSSEQPFAPKSSHTIFITGPEKGFSEQELVFLKQKAKAVRLGPYVLRTETAPLVAASLFGALKHKPDAAAR